MAPSTGKVNRLAHRLLELGCGRDRLVGLCLDRSLDLPAAVWAVLKAGGAYVPLAVDDPDLRLKELIDDAGLEIILCDAATAPRLRPFAQHVIVAAEAAAAADRPDRNPGIGIDGDQLAYTIFTSGSTGRPKGVMMEHAAIHQPHRLDAGSVPAGTRRSRPAEDALHLRRVGLGVPLALHRRRHAGGGAPGRPQIADYLVRPCADEGVTCAHFVPSMLRMFLARRAWGGLGLRLVVCSGEALPYDLQRAISFERL